MVFWDLFKCSFNYWCFIVSVIDEWVRTEYVWNHTDRGSLICLKKLCPCVTLSTTNSTQKGLGSNVGSRLWEVDTNRLSHGTTVWYVILCSLGYWSQILQKPVASVFRAKAEALWRSKVQNEKRGHAQGTINKPTGNHGIKSSFRKVSCKRWWKMVCMIKKSVKRYFQQNSRTFCFVSGLHYQIQKASQRYWWCEMFQC